jgi:hypothetical protein
LLLAHRCRCPEEYVIIPGRFHRRKHRLFGAHFPEFRSDTCPRVSLPLLHAFHPTDRAYRLPRCLRFLPRPILCLHGIALSLARKRQRSALGDLFQEDIERSG